MPMSTALVRTRTAKREWWRSSAAVSSTTNRRQINGDGLQTRDYVYVDDVVRANLAAINLPGFSIFNVGTGIETDVNQLFDHIAEAADYDAAPNHGPGNGRRATALLHFLRPPAGRVERRRRYARSPAGIPATVDWFRTH